MKHILFAIPVIAMVASCNAPNYSDHYTIGIDPNFTDDERFLVLYGLNKWVEGTANTNDPLVFDKVIMADCNAWVNDTQHLICIHRSNTVEIQFQFNGGGYPNSDGLANRNKDMDSTDCYVAMDTYSVQKQGMFQHIVEHEFGHALGLSHDKSNTVMCWREDCASYDVSDIDVYQYLTLRSLRNDN